MKLACIGILLATTVSVPAFATPYGAGDISTSQVDPATLQITARADVHTTSQTIQHFVLMRAAQETTKRGFDLFLMVPSPDSTAMASSSHAATIASGKTGETMLVMMFRGEKPSNAPANLYRASDLLPFSTLYTDQQ